MAKTTEQKLVSILVQLPGGRGVGVGSKSGDKGDPAMGYLMKAISGGRKPGCFEGGGGRANPLTGAMKSRPAPRVRSGMDPIMRALQRKGR